MRSFVYFVRRLGLLLNVSDCHGAVDDFERGELYCVSHASKYAHLWREF